jgi:hypothetical protein
MDAVNSTIQMGKQIREQHSKIQKQKEKLLREIKLSETKLRTAQDELTSENMTLEKVLMMVSDVHRILCTSLRTIEPFVPIHFLKRIILCIITNIAEHALEVQQTYVY